MAIKNISSLEFSQFVPHSTALYSFVGDAVEWFADEAGAILGIIGGCRTPGQWFYAILQRYGGNNFRITKIKTQLKSLAVARTKLLKAMESA